VTASAQRVSVVIPSLDRCDRLLRLLGALRRQEVSEPFEVVIADDGSTDGTVHAAMEAALDMPFAVRVIPWTTRTGAGPARNRGWHTSTGDYVVFVDDDCVPAPGWLAAMVRALDDADVVVGRTKPPPDQLQLIGPFSSYMDIESEECFPTCNIGYRRQVLEQLGGFDEERFRLHNGEDTDLGLRAKKAGFRTAYAPASLVYHDVRRSEFLPYFKRIKDREALVALVARHPEARRLLSVGWWLRSTDKAVPLVWASALELAIHPRNRWSWGLAAAAGGLYLWEFRHAFYRAQSVQEQLAAIPLGFLADTWSMAVMIRGSLRYRTLFV
jgi:GT2 family glycosyltransferase